eukprot:m.112028 g.112028  ORF g.112028 m.112028 type:complete len:830 (-) comp14365_c1_seq1:38-2527(-)
MLLGKVLAAIILFTATATAKERRISSTHDAIHILTCIIPIQILILLMVDFLGRFFAAPLLRRHLDQAVYQSGKMAEAPAANFVPGFATFQAYSQSLITALVAATKVSNALPKGDDFNFHRTDPVFRRKMKLLGDRLINQVENLMQKDPAHTKDIRDSEFDDKDRMGLIRDVCTSSLDRVDAILEALSAGPGADNTPTVVQASTWSNQGTFKRVRFVHAKNIRRPQEDFPVPVDNTPAVFLPPIKDKPNAKTPLLVEPNRHPYLKEIETLELQPWQSVAREPTPAQPLSGPCHWVDTLAELQCVATALASVKEFAVDLEAHSFRSYQGFTCLMQISTRTEDFLIDTLALRAHMGLLLPAFTNPAIVKVLHGADFDVEWLQRDFGLYVVNMFDTGQAMRVLGMPKFSLAYLLSTMCQVSANKAFQLADWRIRPLSAEMLHYAREDTHYLLFMYDRLVNQLLEQGNSFNNLINAVHERSNELCLKVYQKPEYSLERADELLAKSSKTLDAVQKQVFYALHQWRDALARAEDESLRFVLPDHMLVEIAEICPRDSSQILACCQPTPPLVRLHVTNMLEIVTAAKSTLPRQPSFVPELQHPLNSAHIDGDAVDENDNYDIKPDMLFQAAAWIEQPPPATVLFHSDDEDFDMEALQRAVRIRSTFASAPVFGPSVAAKRVEEPDFGRKMSSESIDSGGEAAAVEPQTYTEIYRLSNINRRRNKEKKKSREGAEDGAGDSGDEEPEQLGQDPEAFMQSIGWVSTADSQAFAAGQAAAAPPSAIPAYDYGAAPMLPVGLDAKGSFNPHQDDPQRHGGSRGLPVTSKHGSRSITLSKK